jgi:transcriptional regulator with XRE-family HTH domain
MLIGERLKALRERKGMSQGDVEKRTGLLRCYISRVENEHTVPSVDTLEKLARALEIPTYRIFTDDEHVKKPNIPAETIRSRASNSQQDQQVRALAKLLSRMSEKDRRILFHMASKMARRA